MSVTLLDVSVLLPLVEADHEFRAPVLRWFARQRNDGWATCPLTEAGFVRITAHKMGGNQAVRAAMETLALLSGSPGHHFWTLSDSILDIRPEIRARAYGPKQLTDAILLDLAIRRHGKFATLDTRVHALLPPDSHHQAAIELINPHAGN